MYLYSALFIVSHTQGAQAWITQCYLQVQDRESSPVKDRRSTNCATQPTVLMFSWTEMRTVLIDVKKCHLYCCLTLDVLLVATSWPLTPVSVAQWTGKVFCCLGSGHRDLSVCWKLLHRHAIMRSTVTVTKALAIYKLMKLVLSARLTQHPPTVLMQLCCHLANFYETSVFYAVCMCRQQEAPSDEWDEG